MRGTLSHDMPNITVEEFQCPLVCLFLRLIHRFNGIDRWMVAPLVDKALNRVLGPQKRVPIDIVVAFTVPGAHPLTDLNLMVHEVSLIDPG